MKPLDLENFRNADGSITIDRDLGERRYAPDKNPAHQHPDPPSPPAEKPSR